MGLNGDALLHWLSRKQDYYNRGQISDSIAILFLLQMNCALAHKGNVYAHWEKMFGYEIWNRA